MLRMLLPTEAPVYEFKNSGFTGTDVARNYGQVTDFLVAVSIRKIDKVGPLWAD